MDREQEETVQRITARYVAEMRAGQHPQLSDYLARYPQHAAAITDFVTYYHVAEVDLPEETANMPALSEVSRAALDRAFKRLLPPETAPGSSFALLQIAASNQGKSLSQLASETGLSIDILEKLERHLIDIATIPKEVCKRLAKALQQPVITIEASLGLAGSKQVTHSLAEAPTSYRMDVQSNIQAQSFRETIEQSPYLSEEQKSAWRDILTREHL
jgi:hypothetical protein